MRRLTSFTGIMLLSLLVSGWGNVFAAAFCPHIASKHRTRMMEGHSCHLEMTEPSSPTSQQAMDGMEMTTPVAQRSGDSRIIPVGQFTGTCSHCLEKDNSPVTPAISRELSSQKRDAGASLEKSATPVAALTTFFSPKFVATQNAPPGTANRKHLLLGVFLI
jgi:hypothetical protein